MFVRGERQGAVGAQHLECHVVPFTGHHIGGDYLAPISVHRAHHGSVSLEVRQQTEQALKV